MISAAILAALATVVGTSLTWACTPSTFGTPDTPAAPPTPPPAEPTAAPPAAPGPGAPPAIDVNSVPTLSTGNVTSGAHGAIRTSARTRDGERGARSVRAPATRPGAGSGTLGRRVPRPAFEQRARGGTVGTISRGDQAVFGTSAKADPSARARTTSTPSSRSATGDLWAGFKPGSRASVFAAETSARPDEGSGRVTAALAALGLGLAGVAGAMTLVALRGRRARSRATRSGSGATEM